MKKILALVLVLVVAVSAFAACGGEKAPTEKDYTLSIGVVVKENLEKLKVTETVAAVVTDADGKIVLCRLDCVDYTAKYNEDGTLVTTAPTSKVIIGDAYGTMPAGSWTDQGAALESYVIGKTQAEVAAIALEGGKATDADLVAVCSIDVTDLLTAIDNAFKSEHKTAFKAAGALTAGLYNVGSVKDTTKDEAKAVKLTETYAASVLSDGVVVASILDTAEVELKDITDEGAASVSYNGTKRELGENYGSMPAGTWYVQADAYALAANGKTAGDIATLASEGVAGCTIYAGDYKMAVEAAVVSAR
jgi:hypothetical protein